MFVQCFHQQDSKTIIFIIIIVLFFQITPSLAKVLLHTHGWAIGTIIAEYRIDASRLLVTSRIKPPIPPLPPELVVNMGCYGSRTACPVCVIPSYTDKFRSLACGHPFCCQCWAMHFEVQISQGISTGIETTLC